MTGYYKSNAKSGLRRIARVLPMLLVLVSLACALPFVSTPQPTATQPPATATATTPPTPTATPPALPPALVGSDPPQTAELPLNGPITLFFNQPMDQASVEAALSSQMGQTLTFTWLDNATVIVNLSQSLTPDTQVSLTVSDSVRSMQGKPLLQTVSLNYRTAGYLSLAQAIPEPNTSDVDPTNAVIAAFNRPIVALGAGADADLPAAFTLEPAANGRGEWLNTSTYVFYPDPALAGGQQYTVRINPDLKSADGGPLEEARSWSFTTNRPKWLSLEPSTETPWDIDAKVAITFNQPMDTASVENAFRLNTSDGIPVPGTWEWSAEDTVAAFTPANLLARGTNYTVSLSTQAAGRGGAPIEQGIDAPIVTVAPIQVTNTEPANGGQMDPAGNPVLYFSAPPDDENIEQHITIDPAVPDLQPFWDDYQSLLRLVGTYAANTPYTVRIDAGLKDRWGAPLGQEFVYTFTTTAFSPNLTLVSPSRTIFLTAQDTGLRVQAVSLASVPMTLGALPLNEFFQLNSPDGYQLMEALRTRSGPTWEQPITTSTDRMQITDLPVSQSGGPLTPGVYFLHFNFPPGQDQRNIDNGPFLLVISDLQLTLKVSATDALVWAVDLRTNAPAANLPITLYDDKGMVVDQGVTDAQGLFTSDSLALENSYSNVYAVAGQPGDPNFGMALSEWSSGIEGFNFDIQTGSSEPGLKTYLYSDRPIYRPGQTVFFRAIVRQAFNGRYAPPDATRLPLTITGNEGQEITRMELPISAIGTAHGEFTIPPDAAPGYYSINAPQEMNGYLSFQVASYRKPEINLQVGFQAEQIRAGETLRATVNARYFFDAPAGNMDVRWVLYRAPAYFSLPGYRVGREDTSWMDPFQYPMGYPSFGEQIDEGQGQTGPDGLLTVEIPTQATDLLQEYTFEVTVTDESGLPVSGRGRVLVNPDEFFIGLRADTWVSRANEPAGFEIQVVDGQKQPAGPHSLRAVFQKVTWRRIAPPSSNPYDLATYEPEYSPVGSTDFATGADGRARLEFTPPNPGTYMLDVFNVQTPEGQGARSQLLVWVGGAGQAAWPNLPNSRLKLVADKESYTPGDTAQVFIPNSFSQPVQALITIERSIVMKHDLVSIPAEGYLLQVPLPADYAPNVYLSVTLLGSADGKPDFRQGYINLPVTPVEQTLQVSLTGQPQRAGPGDPVSFEIQVNDAAGNPVQGEFSLSVVDLAVLALADPNSLDIVSAFYSQQPLGVRTSLALAAYNRRLLDLPGGLGGGGGAEVPSVARENFPDTAYWDAEVVTGPDGKAQVSVTLPDTLTTWQVDTRGLTADTRVGEAETQIVTAKELLVRPVTPRFFVANDHTELAVVVQNNIGQDLPVQVSLEATGFVLDDPGQQTQNATAPANGRVRVAWWGTAQETDSVDLVFSASGGGFEDASRPANGALPVQRYFTPQTFRTSGILDASGELTELVSLPRSFDPQSGQLTLELSPSLAAAMVRALDALQAAPYESTEQALSTFLPNLETYRTLQDLGIQDSSLQAKLDRNLNTSLQRLLVRQNFDGGWAWWQGEESDPFITTYVLFGLLRAKQAGVSISDSTIDRAVEYLKTTAPQQADASQPATGDTRQPWQWDRLAFQQYVLSEAGSADPGYIDQLLGERDQLSSWAQALLALTLERERPGTTDAQTILSDLQGSAVRSATGAYWEMRQDESGRLAAGYNMQSDLSNTAIVLYVLAQRDPASPLVADATRFLMANRNADGAWSSTYTSAWSLIALNVLMKGTGELGGGFTFDATLNGAPLAQGQPADTQQTTPVIAQAPVSQLYPDYPNSLVIRRTEGPGRLYYALGLEVSRPVEDITPLSQGLTISRAVYPFGEACDEQACAPVGSGQAGQKMTVRLSLTVPHDAYYLAVSDAIPAGAEILDTSLKTSELGIDGEAETQTVYDPRRPFAAGWGWWLFNAPQVSDTAITWTTRFLPAGTYELTYTLVLLQPGEYRVLPARAWELYFPEVQANSAGSVFEIKP